ncbi:unnamed protein product [Leptidea sinapis]|uniref:Uncharacterized protein n=1 Tax=Leptidea sinapis TaxID=189913 RepID=A0A5E4PT27_9NEOP|nr:unnamed protein product [Leptidea sinapis]
MHSLYQAHYWYRWHSIHFLRRPTLAQRLLHLQVVQDLARQQGLHRRWPRHHLLRMRQGETQRQNSSASSR